MASKTLPILSLLILLSFTSTSLHAFACGDSCSKPTYPTPNNPTYKRPKYWPPYFNPPAVTGPPTVLPGTPTGTSSPPTSCSLDKFKLGLCLDVLGGLVHAGLGDPAENVCCPVLNGLLEVEAAVCLCTEIKLRLLNLDIYIPLALKLLVTCGKNPANYICPLN